MTEEEKRAAVVAEALTWQSTPWHHMARVKGEGVDCAMLLLEVFHQAGLMPHIDPGYYPQDWAVHRSEERYLGGLFEYAHEVNAPLPGDVAVFRFGRCYSHAAIVIDWPTGIHAYVRDGVVLADLTQGHLAERQVKFFSVI